MPRSASILTVASRVRGGMEGSTAGIDRTMNPVHDGAEEEGVDAVVEKKTNKDEQTVVEHLTETAEHKLQKGATTELAVGAEQTVGQIGKTLNATFGGAGDVVEQMFLAVNTLQSVALLTLPDFLPWPEGWLVWMPSFSFFSFGLFDVAFPSAPGAQLGASLVVPALLLARGVHLHWQMNRDEGLDERCAAWLRSNTAIAADGKVNEEDGWPRTRARLFLGGVVAPLLALAAAFAALQVGDGLWVSTTSQEENTGSSSTFTGERESEPPRALTTAAAIIFGALSGVAVSSCVVLVHKTALRRMLFTIRARGKLGVEGIEEFFRTWQYRETTLLIFLYSVTYIGAVTACLKHMVQLQSSEWWVPVVAVGGVYAAPTGLFAGVLNFGNSLGLTSENLLLLSAPLTSIGSIVAIVALSSSGFAVATAWVCGPGYMAIPIGVFGLAAKQAQQDVEENEEDEEHGVKNHEVRRKVTGAPLADEEKWLRRIDRRKKTDREDRTKVEIAAFMMLIHSYEERFWCVINTSTLHTA